MGKIAEQIMEKVKQIVLEFNMKDVDKIVKKQQVVFLITIQIKDFKEEQEEPSMPVIEIDHCDCN